MNRNESRTPPHNATALNENVIAGEGWLRRSWADLCIIPGA
jgi:hypothetical protein